jgi:hypothetical protein
LAKTLSKLQGLTTLEAGRLALFKVGQQLQALADRSGGSARLARAGEAWGSAWLEVWAGAGMRAWLERPGAGTFWFEPADPAEWGRLTCTAADLELAAATAAGRFAVLGSGTVDLGSPPAWRRDLYTGREWPLEAASRVPLVRGDGSDIRTVWELSRCYHFTALGRAWAATGDAAYAKAFAAHVSSFAADNPVGLGPHWASPMDVAIRSANWAMAAWLFRDAPLPAEFWAAMLAQLRVSGRFLERHMEWHPVYRGNHFVANATGLVYLGTLFRGTPDGDRWLAAGHRHLVSELAYQVCDDGVSFEGSLAYHRLVTELFAYAGEVLRRNVPSFDAGAWDARMAQLHGFIGCYLQPDGRAPMIGDADDGRLHAVSATSLGEPRRHALGLPPRHAVVPAPDGAHSFPAGGFHVLRHGGHHAVIRCGPVGLKGAGSHDHNDQLSFELVVGGRRVVADPGTYGYGRDLVARHAFRSVTAHSAVQLGDEEPNPIDVARPWRVLADRTRSRCTRCAAVGDWLVFEGEHAGYAHRPSAALCRRRLELDTGSGTWQLTDEVAGSGEEWLAWRLQLAAAPDAVRATPIGPGRWRVVVPGVVLEVNVPAGVDLATAPAPGSDAYGTMDQRCAVVATGRVKLPAVVRCRIEADRDSSDGERERQ